VPDPLHTLRTPDEALAALRALPAAGRLLAAVGPDDEAWLVGGAVRDLLLGRTPRELDVAVVGDPAGLAARLGTVVQRHDRFGTLEVATDEGVRHDLARARRETYARPGALPAVEPVARIEDDLPRRDVSVNAIALRLPDGPLAELPGAREDLAAGRLRVLHERSFVDDPTRVWRTARYAARLGFEVEPGTRALAAAADPFAISGPRHGAELRLALAEPDPGAVLALLQDLNPRFLPPGFQPRPRGLADALALLPAGGRADLVRLAASCGGVSLEHLLPWLTDMGFSSAEIDVVGAGSRAATLSPLTAARTPSEIHRAAAGAPPEVVALAGGPNAEAWFSGLRDVTLSIDGHDVAAAGVPAGPGVGEALRRALEAKLDGRLDPALDPREAELAAALGTAVRP
jgi:tRNA nucleotidyltransferase (CCA-adding enzyme)